jgi:hypothetical protein
MSVMEGLRLALWVALGAIADDIASPSGVKIDKSAEQPRTSRPWPDFYRAKEGRCDEGPGITAHDP